MNSLWGWHINSFWYWYWKKENSFWYSRRRWLWRCTPGWHRGLRLLPTGGGWERRWRECPRCAPHRTWTHISFFSFNERHKTVEFSVLNSMYIYLHKGFKSIWPICIHLPHNPSIQPFLQLKVSVEIVFFIICNNQGLRTVTSTFPCLENM